MLRSYKSRAEPTALLSVPGMDFGAGARLEVGGGAQVLLLPVGFDPRDGNLLRQMNGIAAERQPRRRFIEARDQEDDGRGPATKGLPPGLQSIRLYPRL